MYKHILVPVDGSELSSHAATSAVAFARSISARITFLHVQPDYPRPIVGEGTLIAPENREDFLRGTQEVADAILHKVSALAEGAGVAASTRTEVNDIPWEVITRTAVAEQCDLIFMASHGRRGLAGLLIGSETHKVLTHTTTPVLVYREK
ncbi:universal stress protein [Uliginosibacterium sp. H3]|uniref:Universal stress protein n=1 Tax=Uliginosibacterium silvisoli TaxID=3114758 RepID=A0ABU6K2S6_9RHOO|nr:universal stress protein [Uliginosibacterium sp. H3]